MYFIPLTFNKHQITLSLKRGLKYSIPRFPTAFAILDLGQIELSSPAKLSDLTIVFGNIISFLAPIAAVAFLVMLIVGGFQFLTSGGDAKAVGAARTTLTYAIIGIILVVASWLILLIIGNITGADVTTVTIPESP